MRLLPVAGFHARMPRINRTQHREGTMPTDKTDSAILAEIREVMVDFQSDLRVKYTKEGGYQRMNEALAYWIIRDLAEGKETELLQDYRETKREAAPAPPKPAP